MENSGLPGYTVSDITFDNKGRAWITTGKGEVNTFDGSDWNAYTPPLTSYTAKLITFDKQNRVWISTEKEISVFDGKDWVSYSTNAVDLGSSRSGKIVSIVFDSQERVWVNRTRVFDGKTWNYFFDPYHLGVYDTTVDNVGNIWISTDEGVVIIRPDSPQPVQYTIGVISLAIAKGALAYFTLLLLIVWISVAYNTWRNIGFGLLGLPVYFIFLIMLPSIYGSSIYENYYDGSFGMDNIFILNPAVFGTIGGIIGGLAEIFIKRHGSTSTKKWGLIGFVVGIILSFCVIVVPGYFVQ